MSKSGAKMNKIVQKWQFQKTFYTTMETVLGFSQNRLAELFQNYVFSTNQYLYFDLYVAECQIQFFWPASRFGVYVLWMQKLLLVTKNELISQSGDRVMAKKPFSAFLDNFWTFCSRLISIDATSLPIPSTSWNLSIVQV